MTRKDYIKLAQIIKDSSYHLKVRSRHVVLDRGEFMQGLCGMLKDDNPNFDERKFREAIRKVTGEMLG
jgi:tetraacyldisaccharide-1-P 4'-kinase